MCIIVLRGEKELRAVPLCAMMVMASGHTVPMCNGWVVGQLPTSYHIIQIALDFTRVRKIQIAKNSFLSRREPTKHIKITSVATFWVLYLRIVGRVQIHGI